MVDNSIGESFREIVEIDLDGRGFGITGGENDGGGGGVEIEWVGVEGEGIRGFEKGVEESVEG